MPQVLGIDAGHGVVRAGGQPLVQGHGADVEHGQVGRCEIAFVDYHLH